MGILLPVRARSVAFSESSITSILIKLIPKAVAAAWLQVKPSRHFKSTVSKSSEVHKPAAMAGSMEAYIGTVPGCC